MAIRIRAFYYCASFIYLLFILGQLLTVKLRDDSLVQGTILCTTYFVHYIFCAVHTKKSLFQCGFETNILKPVITDTEKSCLVYHSIIFPQK